MAGKAAASGAAAGGDAGTLAGRLAGQGLDRAGVIDAMTGLGYSKRDAASAADAAGMPASINPAGGAAPPAATPPAGGPSGKGGGRAKPGPRSGGLGGALKAGGLDVGKPTLKLPGKPSAGDVSGFAFGLLLYVLALSYIKYGKDGPRAWLAAKFLNKPMTPATGTGKPRKGDGADQGDDAAQSDWHPRKGHRGRHQRHDDSAEV